MNILVSNISKAYGDHVVFDNFSCEFPQGEITSLEAPSGAGKTTLLRMILGLEKPDAGEIQNVPVVKSAVFQEDRLLAGISVFGNLKAALPGNTSDDLICKGLALLELPAERKAAELSGGMARRLALLRAMLSPGALLILDEPFNGLDSQTRVLAAKAITQYRSGRTTILVSHREEERKLLDCTHRIMIPSK